MCENLAEFLRSRPTLPADPSDASRSWEDLKSGMALPEVSCSFTRCLWHGDTDDALKAHLLNDHAAQFRRACGEDDEIWFDVYLGAIASIERRQIPAVGLTKDRQMLRKLTRRYNDETICSLVCMVCGQIKTKTPAENSHIDWQGLGWLAKLPKASKTLDMNCGWDEWSKDYGSKHPLNVYGPGRHEGVPQKDWCLEIDLYPAFAMSSCFSFQSLLDASRFVVGHSHQQHHLYRHPHTRTHTNTQQIHTPTHPYTHW